MYIKNKLGKYIVNRVLEGLQPPYFIGVFEAESPIATKKIRAFCKGVGANCFKAKGKVLRRLIKVGAVPLLFKYFKGDFVLVFAESNNSFLRGIFDSGLYIHFVGALENNVYYTRSRISFVYSKKINIINSIANFFVFFFYFIKVHLLRKVFLQIKMLGI